MSSLALSGIIFVLTLGGIFLGALLRRTLPKHHLSEDAQDTVRLDLLDLRILRIERTLCRRDQQAENQRGYRRYQPDAEPYSVLSVLAEVVFR